MYNVVVVFIQIFMDCFCLLHILNTIQVSDFFKQYTLDMINSNKTYWTKFTIKQSTYCIGCWLWYCRFSI